MLNFVYCRGPRSFYSGAVECFSLKYCFSLDKNQTEDKKPQKKARNKDGSSTGLAEKPLGRGLQPVSTVFFSCTAYSCEVGRATALMHVKLISLVSSDSHGAIQQETSNPTLCGQLTAGRD